jgi:hypothetical protein
MIRHGNFHSCSPGRRLTQPVSALTIPMIEPAFKAALMPAAGLAPLCGTSPEATRMAAITMPPVTMETDKEPGAAIWRRAEFLVEGEVVGCRHSGLDGVGGLQAPGDGDIALFFRCVASASRRLK